MFARLNQIQLREVIFICVLNVLDYYFYNETMKKKCTAPWADGASGQHTMEQKHNAEGVEKFLQTMDILRELYTLTMDDNL